MGLAPRPIPAILEPANWGRLPILDNGEPLVDMASSERIRCASIYADAKIPGASEIIRLRAGVAARLDRAARALPEPLALCVADGYRPLCVQAFLWDLVAADLSRRDPTLLGDELANAVGRFVASPVADPLRPPPHRTGGAVDVSLIERATGAIVPMGTALDETVAESRTNHFERHPSEPFTTNRRILFHALTDAGFANYSGEWWHFDFGNQRWANVVGAPHAVYGLPPNEPPDSLWAPPAAPAR